MPSVLGVPHRGRKFALLTILFLPAGALILEAVDNSFTEHEKKCLLEVEIEDVLEMKSFKLDLLMYFFLNFIDSFLTYE